MKTKSPMEMYMQTAKLVLTFELSDREAIHKFHFKYQDGSALLTNERCMVNILMASFYYIETNDLNI